MPEKNEIYVHIPFCVRKCLYCDFNSFCGSDEQKDAYLKALLAEIEGEKAGNSNKTAETVFFGGGTPSAVPPLFIDKILCKLNETYNISKNAEISMEINPGTVDKESLHNYKEMGINRLSIGVQSFDDGELKTLGRIHDVKEAIHAFEMARSVGFENINLDLISSIPGQNCRDMQRNLEMACGLMPEHLSVYSLIIENGTPFYEAAGRGGLDLPDEDEVCRIDEITLRTLEKNGYLRYEISNYAREGFECRHNLGYWDRSCYRGFGLSASTFEGKLRFTAEDDFEAYLSDCQKPFEERKNAREYRILGKKDEMEEFMFLGLRKCAGVFAEDFFEAFETDLFSVYGDVIKRYVGTGHMGQYKKGGKTGIFLTKKGMDVANPILAEFLL